MAARRQWASQFVDACLAKGIEVVAITDHHEMVIIADVLEEVRNRKCDLWVIPGMELTLQGGCQCLILFDQDLPETWWLQAQGCLGINHAALDKMASRGAAVTQLPYSYIEIPKRLDPISELRGRYIVLPNVSEGGRFTVVTNGEHKNFREMPYVGGYVDAGQTLATMRPRHRARLSGSDANWGHRFIYPLPTSDCREAGFAKLGTNNAWIKLSDPTAESIRQAFLAWQSRFAAEVPSYAGLIIKTIEIRGANPLADTVLTLSPEFNAFIGGRGSGKSTVLEYLAFGLGRSCYDLADKPYSGLERLASLTKDTVISEGGEVSVTISQDGAEFQISRGPQTSYQPRIVYPNGKSEVLSPKDIRSLFPAFVYSQGELSELGRDVGEETSVSDLLTFIRAPFKSEADEAEKAISDAKLALTVMLRRFVELWKLQSDKARTENRLNAAAARIVALQSTLPKLEPADQEILDKHQKLLEVSQQAARIQKDLTEVDTLTVEIGTKLSGIQQIKTTLSDAAIKAVEEARLKLVKRAAAASGQLKSQLDVDMKEVASAIATLQTAVAAHKKQHDAIVSKIGAHQVAAKQIAELQSQVAKEKDLIQQIEKQIAVIGDLGASFRATRQQLKQAVGDQVRRVRQWATEIETLSDSTISVLIEDEGDRRKIHEALETLAVRTRSQETTRIRNFANLAASLEGNWTVLDRLLSEVGALLRWKIGTGDTGEDKSPPKIATLSSVLGDSESIVRAFTEHVDEGRFIAIGEAVPLARVSFKYKSEGKEIAFEKASEGQRAAVLLTMLLKQSGGPLMIDQPESDLDNSVVTKVVELLHQMKSRRQLVVATHNANLVVNGAAELVVFMANNENGRRIAGEIGAIDSANVRRAITQTMEGGEQAFKDRQRKYGF